MNQKLHTKKVTSIVLLMNDQQCATGSLDGTLIIWSLISKIPLTKMHILSTAALAEGDKVCCGITALAYNYAESVLLSCGLDKRITYWNMDKY